MASGEYTLYLEPVDGPDGAPAADTGPEVKCDFVGSSSSAPQARGGAALCIVDGAALVFGGASRTQEYFESVHRIGVAGGAGSWEVVDVQGDLPSPRGGLSLVVHAGSVWAYGGSNMALEKCYGDLHVLHLSASPRPTWHLVETKGDVPAERNSHAAVEVNNEMVVFGGANEEGTLADVACLNFEALEWRKAVVGESAGPSAREMHAACASSGYMFVSGGRQVDGAVCCDLWALQMAGEAWTWSRRSDPEEMSCAHILEALAGGRLFLFGGWNGGSCILNSASIYDVAEDTWTPMPVAPPPAERFAHASAASPDGTSVFVFGGINFLQDHADLMRLTPPLPPGAKPPASET